MVRFLPPFILAPSNLHLWAQPDKLAESRCSEWDHPLSGETNSEAVRIAPVQNRLKNIHNPISHFPATISTNNSMLVSLWIMLVYFYKNKGKL